MGHLVWRARKSSRRDLPQSYRGETQRPHEIEIWGSGEQTRSFMFIDDCIKGIDMITRSQILDPINLGSSEAVSINGLVDYVEEIADIKLRRNTI